MESILKLQNPIQEYAWGSRTAIADLLGEPSPSAVPQAEMWIGAHPKAASVVETAAGEISLADLIRERPARILGLRVAAAFNNRLPFLFKVLAVEAPLSIQAHPDQKLAREGFARENRQKIAIDDFKRNYRDDSHKPEIICALTPFWGMNGFRKASQIIRLMDAYLPEKNVGVTQHLQQQGSSGLRRFYESLTTAPKELRREMALQAAAAAASHPRDDAVARWVQTLHRYYPGDIGVLSPLILNLVCLQPGEAMYLPAGELHAYLSGTGIELMANSDNVLRGGLTPKHVDLPELMKALTFAEREVRPLLPHKQPDGSETYPCAAREFALSVIRVSAGKSYVHPANSGIEILLCTRGNAVLTDSESGRKIAVTRGQAVMVTGSTEDYRISGEAELFRASVPE